MDSSASGIVDSFLSGFVDSPVWLCGFSCLALWILLPGFVDSSSLLFGQIHFDFFSFFFWGGGGGGLGLFYVLGFILMKIPVFKANSVDPDQMPQMLDLHSFPSVVFICSV